VISATEFGKEAKVKKQQREILIVGKLPADVVAHIEAAEYGVPALPAVKPAPLPNPRHGRA
jgi:hypothetical protein